MARGVSNTEIAERPVRRRGDGEDPRQQHLHEARRPRPLRGHRVRLRPRRRHARAAGRRVVGHQRHLLPPTVADARPDPVGRCAPCRPDLASARGPSRSQRGLRPAPPACDRVWLSRSWPRRAYRDVLGDVLTTDVEITSDGIERANDMLDRAFPQNRAERERQITEAVVLRATTGAIPPGHERAGGGSRALRARARPRSWRPTAGRSYRATAMRACCWSGSDSTARTTCRTSTRPCSASTTSRIRGGGDGERTSDADQESSPATTCAQASCSSGCRPRS